MEQQSIHRNTTWSSYCECSHVLKQRLENIPELDSLAFFFYYVYKRSNVLKFFQFFRDCFVPDYEYQVGDT